MSNSKTTELREMLKELDATRKAKSILEKSNTNLVLQATVRIRKTENLVSDYQHLSTEDSCIRHIFYKHYCNMLEEAEEALVKKIRKYAEDI